MWILHEIIVDFEIVLEGTFILCNASNWMEGQRMRARVTKSEFIQLSSVSPQTKVQEVVLKLEVGYPHRQRRNIYLCLMWLIHEAHNLNRVNDLWGHIIRVLASWTRKVRLSTLSSSFLTTIATIDPHCLRETYIIL